MSVSVGRFGLRLRAIVRYSRLRTIGFHTLIGFMRLRFVGFVVLFKYLFGCHVHVYVPREIQPHR